MQLKSHPHPFPLTGALAEPLGAAAMEALQAKEDYQAMLKVVSAPSGEHFTRLLESLPPDQRNNISEEALNVNHLSQVLRQYILPPDEVLLVRVSNITEALPIQQPVVGQAYSMLYFRFGGHCSYHMNLGGRGAYPRTHSDHIDERVATSMFPHLAIAHGPDIKGYKTLDAVRKTDLTRGGEGQIALVRHMLEKAGTIQRVPDRAYNPILCDTGCKSGWDLRRFVPLRLPDVEMLGEAQLLSGAQYETLYDLLVDREYQYEYDYEYEYQ